MSPFKTNLPLKKFTLNFFTTWANEMLVQAFHLLEICAIPISENTILKNFIFYCKHLLQDFIKQSIFLSQVDYHSIILLLPVIEILHLNHQHFAFP